jgi:hypothetical protein
MWRFVAVMVVLVTGLVVGGAVWAADADPDGVSRAAGHQGHETHSPPLTARDADRGGDTATRHRHGEGGRSGEGADVDATQASGHHATLTPYAERYAAATDEDQAAADELAADVEATLARYQDIHDAIADGYQPPENPHGNFEHLYDRGVLRERQVFDVNRPNGLVYYTGGDGAPELLGAVFIVPPGLPTPSPAGDLVVWHAHGPACPNFFVTDDAPCTNTRRMLHVWTSDTVEFVRQGSGKPYDVRFSDPFGSPFGETITRVG